MKVDKILVILAGVLFFIGALVNVVIWIIIPVPLWVGYLLLFALTGIPISTLETVWFGITLFVFVLGASCFSGRKNLSQHRMGFILIGVLGFIISGASFIFVGLLGMFSILPSIFAIIAGAIADSSGA